MNESGPWVVLRIGDPVNHCGTIHRLESVTIGEIDYAILVSENGVRRKVSVSLHTTDDRFCVGALSLADQPPAKVRQMSGQTVPVKIEMNCATYERAKLMANEREIAVDFLIHELIWNTREGGTCRDSERMSES